MNRYDRWGHPDFNRDVSTNSTTGAIILIIRTKYITTFEPLRPL